MDEGMRKLLNPITLRIRPLSPRHVRDQQEDSVVMLLELVFC